MVRNRRKLLNKRRNRYQEKDRKGDCIFLNFFDYAWNTDFIIVSQNLIGLYS